jgi:hypothetical protein
MDDDLRDVSDDELEERRGEHADERPNPTVEANEEAEDAPGYADALADEFGEMKELDEED